MQTLRKRRGLCQGLLPAGPAARSSCCPQCLLPAVPAAQSACCPQGLLPAVLCAQEGAGEMICSQGQQVRLGCGPNQCLGRQRRGKDGAAVLFLRTGRQVFLSYGRASAEPFYGEPGQRAHNRPVVARGLRGLFSFDSARPAPRRGGPSGPSSCPLHGSERMVTTSQHSWTEGVWVVKQAWAGVGGGRLPCPGVHRHEALLEAGSESPQSPGFSLTPHCLPLWGQRP